MSHLLDSYLSGEIREDCDQVSQPNEDGSGSDVAFRNGAAAGTGEREVEMMDVAAQGPELSRASEDEPLLSKLNESDHEPGEKGRL